VYGTLLVNFGKTYFSESFPELWLFLIGALFIGVVMVFPNGLAGIDTARIAGGLRTLGRRFAKTRVAPTPPRDPSTLAGPGGA